MSNKDDYCFSFTAICEYFGWAPSFVRKSIIEYLRVNQRTEPKLRRRQVRKGWKVGHKC